MTADLDEVEARAKCVSQAEGAIGELTQALAFDVPALVAEVRRLDAENEWLRSERDAAFAEHTRRVLLEGVWVARVERAEAERDELRSRMDRVRALPGKWRESVEERRGPNWDGCRESERDDGRGPSFDRGVLWAAREFEAAMSGKDGCQ